MSNKTKKKILTLSLVIALLAIVMIGSSLAWFTAEEEVTNVFTVGSVEILQKEQQTGEDGELEDFENDKDLIPVVKDDPTDTEDNYEEKFVTVENVGKNPAYVQTFVAIPKELDKYDILHMWYENAENNGWTAPEWMEPKEIDGLMYNIYRFRYTSELAPGAETGRCLEYIYIDKLVDVTRMDTDDDEVIDAVYFVKPVDGENVTVTTHNLMTNKVNVYVATQACQSEGFAGYVEALDTVFGSTLTDTPDFVSE